MTDIIDAIELITSEMEGVLLTVLTKKWLRLARCGVLATAIVALNTATSPAQPTAPVESTPPPATPAVPTTKLLAIGSLTAKALPNVLHTILPSEMRETARLYLAGKIDQWYVKQDQTGVVFIMNLTDQKEAHALLDKLPLGQAGLMEFQIIPLGPLSPLRTLLQENPK